MIRVLLVSGLGCVALAACGGGGPAESADRCAEPFPRAAWRETGRADPGDKAAARVRRELVERLVDCRLLEGRSRGEVAALLGRPPRSGVDDYGRTGTAWSYYIGPDPLQLDVEKLDVLFLPPGRVAELYTPMHGRIVYVRE